MTTAAQLSPEDAARANGYALMGRLLYGAPDEALRAYMLSLPASEDAVPLALAWRTLQQACRDADLDATRLAYDDLFVGVGKAPVTLYTAAYAAPHAPDRHLLALRGELGRMGLGRRQEAGETEDHIAAVCDVMRWLIVNGRGPDAERRFFYGYVAPAADALCAAIEGHPQSSPFYRAVAGWGRAFYEVERTAFELDAVERGLQDARA